MKLTRSFVSLVLSLSLSLFSFLTLPVQSINAQDTKIALQRGYRTGYSDGYMAGYRDSIESSVKNVAKHSEYGKADRAYNKEYGRIDDYRDGYQQGFESGYETGFEKRSFDATLPVDLKKRGSMTTPVVEKQPEKVVNAPSIPDKNVAENVNVNYKNDDAPPVMKGKTEEIAYQPQYNDSIIIIPTDTELIVELIDDLSTERNREGDKFTARIVSPQEISGAIIEGRVGKITKPGRIKRRSEMLLSFDRIVLTDNRWSNFNAILTEVLPSKGDNVKRVDAEGTVEGKSSIKDDSVKVGASTGTGLVVGAIAGGPVGAAVGASVGAAFGVGAVVIERGKHIRLNKQQQLKIRTAYETQIR